MEARVVAVASSEAKYSFEIESYGEGGSVNYKLDGAIRKISMTTRDVDEWRMHEKEIKTRYAETLDVQDSPNRLYNLPFWAMINFTHGKRQHIERESQGKPTAVVRPSGSGLNKHQQSEAPRNQPKQTYSSYKASLEHQPVPPKQVVPQPPKLLTKKKSDNAFVGACCAGNRILIKKAPSPSSLSSPFMDIWNSLVPNNINTNNKSSNNNSNHWFVREQEATCINDPARDSKEEEAME